MSAPSSTTARAVLGALLSGTTLPHEPVAQLGAELFVAQEDQLIFRAWRELADTDGATDAVGVIERLRDRDWLADAGGQAYILALVDELASTVNFGAHVERLRDDAARRQLARLGEWMQQALARGEAPHRVAAEVLARIGDVQGAVHEIRDGRRLRAQPLADIEIDIRNAYVVKGVLSRDSVAVVVGPPGSGKTFFVADLALSVAAGLAWREHRIRQGAVLYLAAENPRSLKNRALAWCDRRGISKGVPFYIADTTLSLRDDAGRVVELARSIEVESGELLQLIVVDTLSRAFGGGDENSAADMGAVVVACDAIRRGTGAAVVLVHHSGKDPSRGARGSSALEAACDTVLAVTDKVAAAQKQRDAETGGAFPFSLEPVVLGEDEDGDQVTTCVVSHIDQGGLSSARRPKLSTAESNALAALEEVLDDRSLCRTAPAECILLGAYRGQIITSIEAWRQRCYARMGDRPSDTKRKAFRRSFDGLQAKKRILSLDDSVWLL